MTLFSSSIIHSFELSLPWPVSLMHSLCWQLCFSFSWFCFRSSNSCHSKAMHFRYTWSSCTYSPLIVWLCLDRCLPGVTAHFTINQLYALASLNFLVGTKNNGDTGMGVCVVLHCSYVSRESSNTLYNLHIIHWALFFFILNLDGLFVDQSPC